MFERNTFKKNYADISVNNRVWWRSILNRIYEVVDDVVRAASPQAAKQSECSQGGVFKSPSAAVEVITDKTR